MRPCPTPGRSIANSDVGAATSDQTGLPRLPVSPSPRAAPNTPADQMVARVDCFAICTAFPVLRAGRHPHLFLSRPAQASLTLRPTGSLNRPRRPLSRGFDPASRPAKPLVSYQVNRQLPGWNLPPLVKRALGAHLKTPDWRHSDIRNRRWHCAAPAAIISLFANQAIFAIAADPRASPDRWRTRGARNTAQRYLGANLQSYTTATHQGRTRSERFSRVYLIAPRPTLRLSEIR
jgi:hypothetical protein